MNTSLKFYSWKELNTYEYVLQQLELEYEVYFNNPDNDKDDSGIIEIKE